MLANSAGRGFIIWPIAAKLFHSVALQQRPRWTGGRMIPERPTLPWDDSDRPPQIYFGRVDLPPVAIYTAPDNFGLCALQLVPVIPSNKRLPSYSNQTVLRQPSVVHHLIPSPARVLIISGITKDSTGAVVGSCQCYLFRNSDKTLQGSVTSDSITGSYSFNTVGPGNAYFVVCYKAGSPDIAGTTRNDLYGV